jgi:tetratricopeptide (TPR) repeat protein
MKRVNSKARDAKTASEGPPASDETVQNGPVPREANTAAVPDVLQLVHSLKDPPKPEFHQLGAPSNEVFSQRGWMRAEAGQHDQAIALFRKAVKRNPNDTIALNRLAISLVRTNRVSEAIVVWRSAVKIRIKRAPSETSRPPDWPPWEGKRWFEHVVQSDKQLKDLYSNLGLAFRLNGQLDGEIATLHEALTIDPKWGQGQVSLAAALAETGQSTEALTLLREAEKQTYFDEETPQKITALLEKYFKDELAKGPEPLAQQNSDIVSERSVHDGLGETPSPEAAAAPQLRMGAALETIDKLAALLPEERRVAFKAKVKAHFEAAAGITARETTTGHEGADFETQPTKSARYSAEQIEFIARNDSTLFARHDRYDEALDAYKHDATNENARALISTHQNLRSKQKELGLEPEPRNILVAQAGSQMRPSTVPPHPEGKRGRGRPRALAAG